MVGDDPPFHVPVFVLTQHPRKPAVMEGGTTFSFVTDGIESALEQARAAAEDRGVALAGGASVASSTSRPGCSRSSRSTSLPSCSGAACGCSPIARAGRSGWSRRACSRRRPSRTCGIA